MHPPKAILVLLSCVILMSSWPQFAKVTGLWVGHPESPFADRMALFKHVLSNDDQWSPVLNQVIKLSMLTLPRYHLTESYKEVLELVQLVDPKIEVNTVMFVIKQLMEKTPWSGTNVNFTAYVLSTGVTCFTYKNVSFVLDRVVKRIGVLAKKIAKNPEKTRDDHLYSVEEALYNVRMLLVVLVDKVAAVEGELAFLTTTLYDFDSQKKMDGHFVLLNVLKSSLTELNEKINNHCGDINTNTIYEYLGKYENVKNPTLLNDDHSINNETLKNEVIEFEKIINSMIEVYDRLDVETMPTETWIQILNYKLPITMEIKFFKNKINVSRTKNFDRSLSSRYFNALLQSEKEAENEKQRQTVEALEKVIKKLEENQEA